MITEERREQLREWGRRGGRARAQMACFAEHQRRAGKRSAEVNDMAALGRRGARAFLAKYGYVRLFKMMRKYRLSHPSPNELQMMELLDSLGVTYEREAEVLGEEALVSVDFYLPDQARVIEVQGQVHFDPMFDHPNKPQTRRELDALRRARIEKAGFKVLEVDYRLLSEPARARYRVIEFLEGLFPGK